MQVAPASRNPHAWNGNWRRWLFNTTQARDFLLGTPELARTIRHRVPFLDSLNHLQMEQLRRYRYGDTDKRVRRAIHLTTYGVAAGLRNSGWPPHRASAPSIADVLARNRTPPADLRGMMPLELVACKRHPSAC
jgi:hypothetical protein